MVMQTMKWHRWKLSQINFERTTSFSDRKLERGGSLSLGQEEDPASSEGVSGSRVVVVVIKAIHLSPRLPIDRPVNIPPVNCGHDVWNTCEKTRDPIIFFPHTCSIQRNGYGQFQLPLGKGKVTLQAKIASLVSY